MRRYKGVPSPRLLKQQNPFQVEYRTDGLGASAGQVDARVEACGGVKLASRTREFAMVHYGFPTEAALDAFLAGGAHVDNVIRP